jgi:hypothetical protein
MTALVDSGCSSILINLNRMKASLAINNFKIETTNATKMQSALSEHGSVVCGQFKTYLTFTDIKGDPFTVYTTAYCVNGLSHDCFISNNLFQSPLFHAMMLTDIQVYVPDFFPNEKKIKYLPIMTAEEMEETKARSLFLANHVAWEPFTPTVVEVINPFKTATRCHTMIVTPTTNNNINMEDERFTTYQTSHKNIN